jgi:hypothetical protein
VRPKSPEPRLCNSGRKEAVAHLGHHGLQGILGVQDVHVQVRRLVLQQAQHGLRLALAPQAARHLHQPVPHHLTVPQAGHAHAHARARTHTHMRMCCNAHRHSHTAPKQHEWIGQLAHVHVAVQQGAALEA